MGQEVRGATIDGIDFFLGRGWATLLLIVVLGRLSVLDRVVVSAFRLVISMVDEWLSVKFCS